MKTAIAIVLASTLGFVLSAQAKTTRKKAKEACIAEGKVNAKGKADKACVKEKMRQ